MTTGFSDVTKGPQDRGCASWIRTGEVQWTQSLITGHLSSSERSGAETPACVQPVLLAPRLCRHWLARSSVCTARSNPCTFCTCQCAHQTLQPCCCRGYPQYSQQGNCRRLCTKVRKKKVLKRGVFKNFFSIIPFLFGMLSFNFNFKRQKKSKNWNFYSLKWFFNKRSSELSTENKQSWRKLY